MYCVLKGAIVTEIIAFSGATDICDKPDCEQAVDEKTGLCLSQRQDCKLATKNRRKPQKKQQLKVTFLVNTSGEDQHLELRTIKKACCILGHDPDYWAESDNATNFQVWQETHLNKTNFDLQLRIWGSKNYHRVDLRGVLNSHNDSVLPLSLVPFIDHSLLLQSVQAHASQENNDD